MDVVVRALVATERVNVPRDLLASPHWPDDQTANRLADACRNAAFKVT
jgi:hypothetical protein